MKKSDARPSPEPSETLREQHASFDLELPDAPDFISQRRQYPLDKALEFVEEIRAMFPLTENQRAMREQVRCTEEFVL